MRQCPVCSEEMVQETRGEVTIDVCAAHGMWLDQTELLLLTEQARHEQAGWGLLWQDLFQRWAGTLRRPVHPPADLERVLRCPVSGAEMRVIDYEGVSIDWSPGHGVWLDSGELEAILHNLRLDPAYLRGVALRIADARL